MVLANKRAVLVIIVGGYCFIEIDGIWSYIEDCVYFWQVLKDKNKNKDYFYDKLMIKKDQQ